MISAPVLLLKNINLRKPLSYIASFIGKLPAAEKTQLTTVRHFSIRPSDKKRLLTKSYAFGMSDIPPLGMTIGEALARAADEAGDKVAIVSFHQNIRKTFSQFQNDVDGLAASFLANGFKPGDKIAMWGPNSYEWVVVQFATAKAGLVLVAINAAYQPAELSYCLKKANCKAVVAGHTFRNQDYYKHLCAVIPELSSCQAGQLKSSNLPDLRLVSVITPNPLPGTLSFEQLCNTADNASRNALNDIQSTVRMDDAVNMMFTSGTTGKPKVAMLTHHSLLNNVHYIRHATWEPDKDVIACCCFPLFHSAGCVTGTLLCVLNKYTCVLPAAAFDPLSVLQAVETEKCTTLYGTPTMYVDILNHKDIDKYNLQSVDSAFIGGAPVSVNIIESIKKRFSSIYVSVMFGSTECSPVVTMTKYTDPDEKCLLTTGLPVAFTEVKVVDRLGQVIPVNAVGEICARGHNTFLGYWDEPEQTEQAMSSDGWYHTGDLGKMDEDGYLSIVGRIKDMVIRGGENIYLREIEDFLQGHPAVREVHGFGVPDERMGEEVCVAIEVKEGMMVTEQEVKDYCQGKISKFKIPRFDYL